MGATKQPDFPHVHQVSLSDGGVPKHAVPSVQVTVDGLTGVASAIESSMADRIGQSASILWRSSRHCVRKAIRSVPVRQVKICLSRELSGQASSRVIASVSAVRCSWKL